MTETGGRDGTGGSLRACAGRVVTWRKGEALASGVEVDEARGLTPSCEVLRASGFADSSSDEEDEYQRSVTTFCRFFFFVPLLLLALGGDDSSRCRRRSFSTFFALTDSLPLPRSDPSLSRPFFAPLAGRETDEARLLDVPTSSSSSNRRFFLSRRSTSSSDSASIFVPPDARFADADLLGAAEDSPAPADERSFARSSRRFSFFSDSLPFRTPPPPARIGAAGFSSTFVSGSSVATALPLSAFAAVSAIGSDSGLVALAPDAIVFCSKLTSLDELDAVEDVDVCRCGDGGRGRLVEAEGAAGRGGEGAVPLAMEARLTDTPEEEELLLRLTAMLLGTVPLPIRNVLLGAGPGG